MPPINWYNLIHIPFSRITALTPTIHHHPITHSHSLHQLIHCWLVPPHLITHSLLVSLYVCPFVRLCVACAFVQISAFTRASSFSLNQISGGVRKLSSVTRYDQTSNPAQTLSSAWSGIRVLLLLYSDKRVLFV